MGYWQEFLDVPSAPRPWRACCDAAGVTPGVVAVGMAQTRRLQDGWAGRVPVVGDFETPLFRRDAMSGLLRNDIRIS